MAGRRYERIVSSCVICRGVESHHGVTTLTVERGQMTLVLKGVPARVCDTCEEGYVDETTTRTVEELVDRLQTTGVELSVAQYTTG